MEATPMPLVRLTAGKAVANTALRWIPFFLPTLAVAFAASTARLTVILGFGEMAGLSTLLIRRHLDAGRERRLMAGALALVAVSASLALVAAIEVFMVAYVLLIVGASVYTVAGHTYLSHRVPYVRRARAIGIFETSWALALLVGAPLVALLIRGFGWRGPFVGVAIIASVVAVVVARADERDVVTAPAVNSPVVKQRLSVDAWVVIAASAAIATAGLTTIVIAGTWLTDRLGVSTGGIGLVAMCFGVAELAASSGSAVIADRAGPVVAIRRALVALLVGLGVMSVAGDSLLIGALGLMVFFVGFEFSIVTSFSIVSEAMPAARGRALATNNAVGTFARGSGTVASGVLYEAHGIRGPVSLSAAACVAAVVLLTVSTRRGASI